MITRKDLCNGCGKWRIAHRVVTKASTAHLFRFDTLPGSLINLDNGRVETFASKTLEEKDYSCRGGILADNPGYGKTCDTCLDSLQFMSRLYS